VFITTLYCCRVIHSLANLAWETIKVYSGCQATNYMKHLDGIPYQPYSSILIPTYISYTKTRRTGLTLVVIVCWLHKTMPPILFVFCPGFHHLFISAHAHE
jgi:hypothetical protein